uniref:Probable purine permease n=1 Tax=Nelumbo nucifera TaxID=4432 RepID=A0A822YIP4_NELNU|nr:TPA_asm: hypothetical protein HUJ06_011213 [Nelumbo nucifera]
MDIQELTGRQVLNKEEKMSKALKRSLLLLFCTFVALGNTGGPLLTRLYFIHGGKRIWLSSWLISIGWPVLLFPFFILYLYRLKSDKDAKLFFMNPYLFAACTILGLVNGFSNYLYGFGLSRLPVSTGGLIGSTQLICTAVFAFLLVGQRFMFYSINSVVLSIMGAIVLAFHASSDRPANESNTQYYVGFAMTVGAALINGLSPPLIELMYKKLKQGITYSLPSLVMEILIVTSIFSNVFCTVGMLVKNDFQVISREAREYGLGETKYYVVLAWSVMIWQVFMLGIIGTIFCASSLWVGVLVAALLPVTEILAIVFYHEKFQSEKGLALALSL